MDLWVELLQKSVRLMLLKGVFPVFVPILFVLFVFFDVYGIKRICVICAISVRLKEFVQSVFDLNALNT